MTPPSETPGRSTPRPARARRAPARGATTDLGSAHVFLTGGTGFVGQAVLERLLVDHPGTTVSVLVRGKGPSGPEARLRQLSKKPVFREWRKSAGNDVVDAAFAERVRVVDGGLGSVPSLPGDLDVVIHSASTVSFDPPINEAFATNVGGALNLYRAVLESGSDPHAVHVSTCYVGGLKKGVQPEARLTHEVDWRAEFDAARAAKESVELASREPAVLRRYIDAARARHGKEGPLAVARAAEEARVAAVTKELVETGRLRAQSLGWTDVYTLTKAFAERAAEELWGEAGHRLSVVRPAIIESALQHPFPGWIDGFKVADPLILAYGRGQLPDFPGLPDSILDLIPVDFVVNAILAAAANPPKPDAPEYYHIASGASNPIPYHRMYENVHRYYTEHPMPKGDGVVAVPEWKFPGERTFARGLWFAKKKTQLAELGLRRLPASDRTRVWGADLAKAKAGIESLQNFTDLYRAYTQTEIIFDDTHARALTAALPAKVRADRGFDVERIDWEDYLQNVHFPAITEMTNVYRMRKQRAAAAPAPKARPPMKQGGDIAAIFDLEGTVVDSNIVEQYLWVRSSGFRKAAWPGTVVKLFGSVGTYLRAEKRDRGEFIRAFLRNYAGMPVARLQKIVGRGGYRNALLGHVSPDALKLILEHREAGHRTVLVTGSMDVLAAPLAGLFDEVVGSAMHERDGVLTGYLAKPPLVDEARGAWLRRWAQLNGVDLASSYGYGDSHADLRWLELVGNPTAVNPDSELSREAHRRQWRIHDWRAAGRLGGGAQVRRDVMEAERDSTGSAGGNEGSAGGNAGSAGGNAGSAGGNVKGKG